jgi:CheY-like chemotaxis protein
LASNTILFADDSATMRVIMEKTFAAEPYDVVAVASGEAALPAARSRRPNIIVLDAGLSDISGYELCQSIRKDETLKNTPVILMFGVSHPYDESKGKECGVSAFIKKPFDTTQLIEKVAELTTAAPAEVIPIDEIEAIPLGQEPKLAAPPPPPPPPRKPTEPAASPLPGLTGSKKTIDFPPRPAARPVPIPQEPSPEDVQMSPEPVASPRPEPIRAATLAELAQVDQAGAPLPQSSTSEAIELDTPPRRSETSAVIASSVDESLTRIAEKVGGLSPGQVEAIRILSSEIIEKVVWEVVPELAETLIKEELARLLEE